MGRMTGEALVEASRGHNLRPSIRICAVSHVIWMNLSYGRHALIKTLRLLYADT